MQRPKNSPRGTKDILALEAYKLALIEDIAKNIFNKAGFREIITPIFENTEIFLRAVGETSDIVSKEMYTFLDKSNRSLTLRPEGTAGVIRAYLSNGLDREPKPQRLWYRGAMFRYERSQTGRYRQFTQLGAEIIGGSGLEIELEAMMLIYKLLQKLNIKDVILEINSLGDTETKYNYGIVLREFLEQNTDNICKDCQRRKEENPLRALDCKDPKDQALYAEFAPKIENYLSEDAKAQLNNLFLSLKDLNIPFIHNKALVRGLDYYTSIVFEFKTQNPALSGQNTICAGGRYDNLIKEFGGQQTPAFGWAMGLERLILLLEEKKESDIPNIFVYYPNSELVSGIKFIESLREKNYNTIGESYLTESQKNKIYEKAKKQNIKTIISYRENPNLPEINFRIGELPDIKGELV